MDTQYYPKARIKWLVWIENGEHFEKIIARQDSQLKFEL